jgi:hypothetical protein
MKKLFYVFIVLFYFVKVSNAEEANSIDTSTQNTDKTSGLRLRESVQEVEKTKTEKSMLMQDTDKFSATQLKDSAQQEEKKHGVSLKVEGLVQTIENAYLKQEKCSSKKCESNIESLFDSYRWTNDFLKLKTVAYPEKPNKANLVILESLLDVMEPGVTNIIEDNGKTSFLYNPDNLNLNEEVFRQYGILKEAKEKIEDAKKEVENKKVDENYLKQKQEDYKTQISEATSKLINLVGKEKTDKIISDIDNHLKNGNSSGASNPFHDIEIVAMLTDNSKGIKESLKKDGISTSKSLQIDRFKSDKGDNINLLQQIDKYANDNTIISISYAPNEKEWVQIARNKSGSVTHSDLSQFDSLKNKRIKENTEKFIFLMALDNDLNRREQLKDFLRVAKEEYPNLWFVSASGKKTGAEDMDIKKDVGIEFFTIFSDYSYPVQPKLNESGEIIDYNYEYIENAQTSFATPLLGLIIKNIRALLPNLSFIGIKNRLYMDSKVFC